MPVWATKIFHPTSTISFTRWSRAESPTKLLLIRFHAIGDVAITLPYACALRRRFVNATIDFLTTADCSDLPSVLDTFNTIFLFPTAKSRWTRMRHTLSWGWKVWQEEYDVIIDLQGNWMSVIVRIFGMTSAWSEFDRFAPKAANERVAETFARAGFETSLQQFTVSFRKEALAEAGDILKNSGWDAATKLVVLNPAGLFPTRSWPLERYVDLARRWSHQENIQFLVLGTERVRAKAAYLRRELGSSLIDLTTKTSLAQAFGVLQHVDCVISEDSGLMHMAWVSGIPTVVLFGSTKSYQSAPSGRHTFTFHSSDLECGNCGQPVCPLGTTECLNRLRPEQVLEAAKTAMSRRNS